MLPIDFTFLGTAAARPYADEGSTAAFIQAGGSRILLDCGEGTQIQLDRLGLPLQKLDVVCISHMHGDHIYGLPGLITSMELGQRTRPLILIGPPDLENYLKTCLALSRAHLSFELIYHSTDYATPRRDVVLLRDLVIHTIPLNHRIPACGFVIEQRDQGRSLRPGVIETYKIPYEDIPRIKAGGSFKLPDGKILSAEALTHPPELPQPIAYFTDTAPIDSYPEAWPVPQTLVHDATFASEHTDLARATGHSTAVEAAAFAKTCRASKLYLTHISRRYKDRTLLVDEARAVFAESFLAQAPA